MSGILARVIAIGGITICATPLYYYVQARWSSDDKKLNAKDSKESHALSALRARVTRPCASKFVNVVFPNTRHWRRNSLKNLVLSRKEGETKTTQQNTLFFPPGMLRIILARSFNTCRNSNVLKKDSSRRNFFMMNEREVNRFSGSDRCKDALNSSTNVSPEVGDSIQRIVTVQIESNPEDHSSTSDNSKDSRISNLFPPSGIGLANSMSERAPCSYCKTSKRRLSTGLSIKWRSLKKLLSHSKANTSRLSKTTIECNGTKRLHLTAPFPSRRTPVGHSTFLCRSHLVERSATSCIQIPSTSQLSSNANKTTEDLQSTSANKHPTTSSREPASSHHDQIEREASRVHICQDVTSFVNVEKDQSATDKFVCTVRMTGLELSSSEIFDVLEMVDGRAQTSSIFSTEETIVVFIKFQKSSRAMSCDDIGMVSCCPLMRCWSTLCERIHDIKWTKMFKSPKRSSSNGVIKDSRDSSNTRRRVHKDDPDVTSSDNELEDFYVIDNAIEAKEELFQMSRIRKVPERDTTSLIGKSGFVN